MYVASYISHDPMQRSLNRVIQIAVLAASLCCCGRVNPSVDPIAVADLSFDGLPGKALGATVAFASEDLIAIGRHSGIDVNLSGALSTVQWKEGKLRFLKTKSLSKYRSFRGGLFRATDGRFISNLVRPPQLLSPDLSPITDITDIPAMSFVPPVEGGNVAGDSDLRRWKIYRLTPTMALLRQGTGQLLSLSDDLLVFRANDEIRIESITGQHLGSFTVLPQSTTVPLRPTCSANVLLLGHDRLYLNGCGPGRVVDFSGKTTVQVPEPDGWGFRYRLTADGRRLLFDNYTRRLSAFQRMAESVERKITFGMAPIVTSKGEIIRVVDTASGKICFDLDSPDRPFGPEGEPHADISPSGRFIAVTAADKLSIYSMPDTCSKNQ